MATDRQRNRLQPDRMRATMMNAKKKAILDRIRRLEEGIARAREYLETGEHADWRRFRPLFDMKVRNGVLLPPHRDWVKNVFLRHYERALATSEKILVQLDLKLSNRARQQERQ